MCPLGGNSIGSDRIFLQKHMPTLEKHLHYRIIDVSSIKEVELSSKPKKFLLFVKIVFHQLLIDVMPSILDLFIGIFQLVKRWYPDIYARKPRKENTHRALNDIYESIQELNWYKKNIFIPQT